MGFTAEQDALLAAPLKPSIVKQRKQGGTSVSYVEGWHVIAEANRIFGYGNWSMETMSNKEVCRYQTDKKDSSGKVIGQNWKIGYEAKVCITVNTSGNYSVVKEGTGHGQGTMGDLYDAIESAAKEAETDAMKRALIKFGNQFGLALYDKERRNVSEYSLSDVKQWLADADSEPMLIAAWQDVPEWLRKEAQPLFAARKAEIKNQEKDPANA